MQPVERFQTCSGKGSKPMIFKIWKLKFIGLVLPDFFKNKWLNNTACKEWISVFVLSMENTWIALTDICILHWKIRTRSALEVEMIKKWFDYFCFYIRTGIISIETCWAPKNVSGLFLAKAPASQMALVWRLWLQHFSGVPWFWSPNSKGQLGAAAVVRFPAPISIRPLLGWQLLVTDFYRMQWYRTWHSSRIHRHYQNNWLQLLHLSVKYKQLWVRSSSTQHRIACKGMVDPRETAKRIYETILLHKGSALSIPATNFMEALLTLN